MSSYALIVEEEKRLVLLNRTAKTPAELVLLEGGIGRVAESKKFFASNMSFRTNSNRLPWKRLAAGFRDDVDHAARLSAELRVVGGLVDTEFLNVVHRWAQNQLLIELIGDIHAVYEVQVMPAALAQNSKRLSCLLQRAPARA